MSCTRADVLAELQRADRPLPTDMIAARLRRSKGTVSSILSKLSLYGKIQRVKVPGTGQGKSPTHYLYSLPVQQ